MPLSAIQFLGLNFAPSRIRLYSQIPFVNTIHYTNTLVTQAEIVTFISMASILKTKIQQQICSIPLHIVGRASFCLYTIIQKAVFYISPSGVNPPKQKNQFSLMLSDLFLEMMHPVMSKQTPTPRCRDSVSFRCAMIQAGAIL